MELPEDDLPIPQWAIVVIVIGVGSLVFVVIFGVTVVSTTFPFTKTIDIPTYTLLTYILAATQSPEARQEDTNPADQ